ncbi:MAG TPA: chemotaxis protein CheW, partial [Burkholderiales bacterium]|nr:chemotaxis protein CheW [Burkholderiales bacterium]
MPDTSVDGVQTAAALRFLTFRIDERVYALRAEDVAEVVRVPAMARVPQSPEALLGIANLRGTVLPAVSLRALLGMAGQAIDSSARA